MHTGIVVLQPTIASADFYRVYVTILAAILAFFFNGLASRAVFIHSCFRSVCDSALFQTL
jgi:hypothetical protein